MPPGDDQRARARTVDALAALVAWYARREAARRKGAFVANDTTPANDVRSPPQETDAPCE